MKVLVVEWKPLDVGDGDVNSEFTVLRYDTGDVMRGQSLRVTGFTFEPPIGALPLFADFDENDSTLDIQASSNIAVRSGNIALARGDALEFVIDGVRVAFAGVDDSITKRSEAKLLEGKLAYSWGAANAEPFVVSGAVIDTGAMCTSEFLDAAREARERAQDEARSEAERTKETARVQAARIGSDARDQFINPYTFVPFPSDEPANFRVEPSGHANMGERYIGYVDVTLTATTPLLTRDDGGKFPRNLSGTPILQGSSLKGALRSLYETLAGGCLRVVDGDYVPVYREMIKVLGNDWKLAVVHEVHGDRPTSFDVATEVAWAPIEVLHGVIPPTALQSGSRISVVSHEPRADRNVVTQAKAGDDWVVHITDAKARNPQRMYHAACGKLNHDLMALESPKVWHRYLQVVDGARDLQSGGGDSKVVHNYEGKPLHIGQRRVATRSLKVGDVAWVKVKDNKIVEIKDSYAWRALGDGKLGDRVPEWLLPCPHVANGDARKRDGTEPTETTSITLMLCPACALFGAADEDSTGATEPARQRAYRGHVRFEDAVVVNPSELALQNVELPPMGRPRPGAGAFYLHLDPTKKSGSRQDMPSAWWGSKFDTRPDTTSDRLPRLVRGRKFYWNADPQKQHPRRDHRGPDQKNAQMGGGAEVLPVGTTLTTRIRFVNVTRAQIGGLLMTLQPELGFTDIDLRSYSTDERATYQIRLGGGKPLGYGAITAVIDELRVDSTESRYMEAPPVDVSPQQLVGEFRTAVDDAIKHTWPEVAAVLKRDHVNPARVAYPPGAEWLESADAKEPANFRTPFEFFKRNSGAFGTDDIVTLPGPPSAIEQVMEIKRKGAPR